MTILNSKDLVLPISYKNRFNINGKHHANSTNSLELSDSNETVNPEKSETPERGQWGSKAEFILSCVGLSVGIGNVWRFPYLAYQNGGGAFLFPYFILMIFIGKPLYLMEVALGQYSNLGPMSVWRCFPLAKGVGAAMVIVSIMVAIYYNVIMGYTLFYAGQSFRSVLPWNGCYDWWGADNSTCYVRDKNSILCSTLQKQLNLSSVESLTNCTNATQTSSEQFWEKYVLNITSSPEELGEIKWDLSVCLLVSWIVVFLCLMKGVKSSGKVVYFTATFPYLILIILLVFGATLKGASKGIYYFFVPEWDKLLEIGVWRKAAEQLFFSLSISWGGLIMFGSYNKFGNKVHRDAFFVSSLDFVTSLIAGIVIFSVLGNMAEEMGIDIKDIVKGGQGLAFVAYPEALAQLKVPQLWSVLFFFMLFLLGLDSEFALLETFLTALYDELPKMRNYKVLITFLTCASCFLLGLPCVTQGGQYVLNLMDTYGGGYSVLVIAVFELLALMWGYGVRRFCSDLEFMLGFRPNYFWQICWAVIAPLVLAFIFIYSLTEHKPITYDTIPYPEWADGIGWVLVLITILQIPLWAIYVLIKNRNNIRNAFKPEPSWGPGDPDARRRRLNDENPEIVLSGRNGIDNPTMDFSSEKF
ncbi:sodium- and chloride-dependent glycine transporter 2-like isoform X4 [Centruroides sculpturatus]|uniref:sodium- and chloride-dependent glycine transporter 2-like isoform X3 n=1 Tax=Centruroides sculpturatus TaxID=218467 RepID=UPI000C6D4F5B|nr:sodium- and chloride-dependent glycine transporter 2-like isoform X3 [Centruroides sculpturatus]XP_023222443.1 sodium- and chloride-dependent glycine transporter 2-like isoform X4 [Centruroides sculpturatus]